jgi:cytochrome c oxidase subunit 2
MFLGPSNISGRIDTAFFLMAATAVVLLVGVMAVMIVFLIKYAKKRHPQPGTVKESVGLEIVWTVVPTFLVMAMFYFGWVDFNYIRNPPKNAMEVGVTARQWSWDFAYANGKESDTLRVPVGRPVKLVMTSADVIHCLFIPAFRIKEDCVPGLTTHLWFTANERGTYELFCSEYCGVEHSHMRSRVVALDPGEFGSWYEAAEETVPEAGGLKLLKEKGCLGCHALDETKLAGPSFKGLFGKKQTVVRDGKEVEVTADEAYLKQSMLDPNKEVVKGYQPIMPKLPLTDEEIKQISDFLKTVK